MLERFKKKTLLAEPVEPKTYLRISFKNGSYRTWSCPIKNNDMAGPWKDFLKWYFSKPDKHFFWLRYAGGMACMERDNIKCFDIEIIRSGE